MEAGEEIADYVWRTDDEALTHALVVSLVRTVVEKYGGTMEIDEETKTFTIDVPDDVIHTCAQEIDTTVGGMC